VAVLSLRFRDRLNRITFADDFHQADECTAISKKGGEFNRHSFQKLLDPFCIKIGPRVFVYAVALRALNHAFPLRTLPLWIFRIRNESRVFIRQGSLTGFASHKPKLHHRLKLYPTVMPSA
jgi:hypothetical protein